MNDMNAIGAIKVDVTPYNNAILEEISLTGTAKNNTNSYAIDTTGQMLFANNNLFAKLLSMSMYKDNKNITPKDISNAYGNWYNLNNLPMDIVMTTSVVMNKDDVKILADTLKNIDVLVPAGDAIKTNNGAIKYPMTIDKDGFKQFVEAINTAFKQPILDPTMIDMMPTEVLYTIINNSHSVLEIGDISMEMKDSTTTITIKDIDNTVLMKMTINDNSFDFMIHNVIIGNGVWTNDIKYVDIYKYTNNKKGNKIAYAELKRQPYTNEYGGSVWMKEGDTEYKLSISKAIISSNSEYLKAHIKLDKSVNNASQEMFNVSVEATKTPINTTDYTLPTKTYNIDEFMNMFMIADNVVVEAPVNTAPIMNGVIKPVKTGGSKVSGERKSLRRLTPISQTFRPTNIAK